MLTAIAAAALGVALGGAWISTRHTGEQMAISLHRSRDICREAERYDDWGRDLYWDLAR